MSTLAKWTGPALIGAIALVGAWSAASTNWRLDTAFADGATQEALQDRFDDALVIRDGAIAAWGSAIWTLFGQTSDGAVPGKNGWLFTDEEYLAEPGLDARLNASVTAIADAKLDSIPMVCITGQVPTPLIGSDAFQECDTVGITRPCTKHNWLVSDVNDLARVLHQAFHVAKSGRPGPVVVDVPKDVQFATGTYVPPSAVENKTYQPQTTGDRLPSQTRALFRPFHQR